MTQYITLLYVLTSSLLSTSTSLSNNNFTTCKWPLYAALCNKEIIHYNNQGMTHITHIYVTGFTKTRHLHTKQNF